jgi:hypothetical protein
MAAPLPLARHRYVSLLDRYADILALSERPWPLRIDAVNAAFRATIAQRAVGFAQSIAQEISRVRCARLLVADGRLDLINPFSGRRLEMVDCQR